MKAFPLKQQQPIQTYVVFVVASVLIGEPHSLSGAVVEAFPLKQLLVLCDE